MIGRERSVNVTAVLPTGRHGGPKVASEVSFLPQRPACAALAVTPTRPLEHLFEGTAGEAYRGSVDRSTSTAALPGGGPDAA